MRPPPPPPQVKSANWEDTKQKILDAIRELRSASLQAEPEFEAMMFIISQAKKVVKASRNADRYRKAKLANRFVAGGVGRSFAKHLVASVDACMRRDSKMAHVVDPSPEAFDSEKVTSFTIDSEFGKGLFGVAAALEDNVKSKQASLTKFLKDTPSVGMMRIDCDPGALAPALALMSTLDPQDKGHLPWAVAMRAHTWRHGPSSFPTPGYGSFVQNSPGFPDMVLMFLPIASVVNKGVSADDLHSFLETSTGADVFQSKALILKASPTTIFWCPYGYLCLPFALGKLTLQDVAAAATTDEVEQEPQEYPLGFFTVMTLFTLSSAQALPAKV